ncbi:molybdate ABC transporter permease subunit [Alteromonas facilis]|uniref:molybdate ABC transporter permease subunit n=1 Tax=Alteromonas facilis TaxID=2048004 RepID=UPI000C283D9C|nr:molybdate ABC transporter permease subunit [Alteromonas facilis]
MLSTSDMQALLLTLKLASTVTILLLCFGIPFSWWLARSRSKLTSLLTALVAMPLILPPTVLGFYILLLLGPEGPVGKVTTQLGFGVFPFTFSGLVIASIVYSLPFTVQPLVSAFEAIPTRTLEVASTLRASPIDTFFSVVLPLSKNGILTAIVLTFAHTIGEFGVILMIGGNIPGETQVVSIQIYDHVESMDYGAAHKLSLIMLIFSFITLTFLQWIRRRRFAFVPVKRR